MRNLPTATAGRASIAIVAAALLSSVFGPASVVSQSSSGTDPSAGTSPTPSPSCAPTDAGAPCPTPSAEPGTFSGTIDWAETTADPGGLGSGVIWNASIELRMAWREDPVLLMAVGGTYSYSYELTGHCAGSVSGSGVVSTELYGETSPGVAAVYADPSGQAPGDVGFRIDVWRDEYQYDCAATPGFDAFQAIDPATEMKPYCVSVLGTNDAGPPQSYALSCPEPQLPEVVVAIDGVLTQAP